MVRAMTVDVMMRKPVRRLQAGALAAVVLLLGLNGAPVHADDASAVRAVLATTWDRPDNPLNVDPVAIVGAHALASWRQGSRGGRALLRRNGDGAWKVVLCSGEPLRHASTLVATGIPAREAQALAAQLNRAESKLAAEDVQLFSTFEGVVHVEDDAHHGHSAPHGDTAHGNEHDSNHAR